MPAMVSRARGRRAINEINMVPFIDVMLVLLIIFMVTAPLIAPSVIELPKVAKASTSTNVALQVWLAADESLKLKRPEQEAQAVALKSLVTEVRAAQRAASAAGAANVPVVIAADKAVRYESVVKVMDTLQRAGVQRVGLSVQVQP